MKTILSCLFLLFSLPLFGQSDSTTIFKCADRYRSISLERTIDNRYLLEGTYLGSLVRGNQYVRGSNFSEFEGEIFALSEFNFPTGINLILENGVSVVFSLTSILIDLEESFLVMNSNDQAVLDDLRSIIGLTDPNDGNIIADATYCDLNF